MIRCLLSDFSSTSKTLHFKGKRAAVCGTYWLQLRENVSKFWLRIGLLLYVLLALFLFIVKEVGIQYVLVVTVGVCCVRSCARAANWKTSGWQRSRSCCSSSSRRRWSVCARSRTSFSPTCSSASRSCSGARRCWTARWTCCSCSSWARATSSQSTRPRRPAPSAPSHTRRSSTDSRTRSAATSRCWSPAPHRIASASTATSRSTPLVCYIYSTIIHHHHTSLANTCSLICSLFSNFAALLLESMKFTSNITMSILAEYSSLRVQDRRIGVISTAGDLFSRRGSIGGAMTSALPINTAQSVQAVQGFPSFALLTCLVLHVNFIQI